MNLVDTSVVVDIDRGGVADRVARLDETGPHAISAVTVTELTLGVHRRYDAGTESHDDALQALDRLLARFELLAVDRAVGSVAADIINDLVASVARLDDLHDIYIGATARTQQLRVLTANVNHFERMADVDVVDWAEY